MDSGGGDHPAEGHLDPQADPCLVFARIGELAAHPAAAVEIDAEIQQQLTNEVKLFNRWSFDDVSIIPSSIH